MAAERMTSTDAAWLHMDRPTNLMVVNSVSWYGGRVDPDRLADVFRQRVLPRFRRLRQRAVEPPVTLGALAPHWADDPAFDLAAHVRQVRLPAPGGDEQLHAYVSQQASRPLDRGRPLWEMHVIDGYGQGTAVLWRSHHAIADGTALWQLTFAFLDPPAGGGRHPGQLPLLADADGDGDGDGDAPPAGPPSTGLLSAARSVLDGLRRRGPLDNLRVLAEEAQMLTRLGFGPADEHSVLRGRLTGRKRMAWSTPLPLDEVRRAARRSGATVNDLCLAAVAGALRRYLQHHGQQVNRLTAVVPVNLRPLDRPFDPGEGNRFGLAYVRLPVAATDPAERLRETKAEMDRAKATGEGLVVAGALSLMGQTPVEMERLWLDLYGNRATLVVTNVTGPQERLAFGGVPLLGSLGWVPATGSIGVGVSIGSYAGSILMGVAVDEGLVPDADVLLAALEEELAELALVTGAA